MVKPKPHIGIDFYGKVYSHATPARTSNAAARGRVIDIFLSIIFGKK
jgi:hypothetical protein